MTGCLDDIETFSRLDKALVNLLLATAKDPTSSAKNVRRKACARDWVTQGESAQHSADRVVLAVDATGKNSVAEIDEDIFARLVSINPPAFNPHANVTHENIRAPKRDVEFPVRVPLRARRWSNLLHFLA